MNAIIDLSSTVLHTPRLTLRSWRREDLGDFFAYASVDGVGQMAGWLPHKTQEETQTILNSFIAHKKAFALESGGTVIGSLGIELYKEENFPELAALRGRSIGYVLSKKHWGQGLMPEAVCAAVRYLFESEGLDFLLVSHFTWNVQSRRVIEKCGFRFLRETTHTTHYGTEEPTCEYILYRKEWQHHADTQRHTAPAD